MAQAISRLGSAIGAGAIVLNFGLMLLQVTHAYDWLEQRRLLPGLVAFADQYRIVTSVNRNFRFFAPSVANNWNVQLLLHDAQGNVRTSALPAQSREWVIRQHALMDHFFRDQAAMDRYGRALATFAFARHPEVVRVTVIVLENVSPSLQQYREGQRLQQQERVRASYGR